MTLFFSNDFIWAPRCKNLKNTYLSIDFPNTVLSWISELINFWPPPVARANLEGSCATSKISTWHFGFLTYFGRFHNEQWQRLRKGFDDNYRGISAFSKKIISSSYENHKKYRFPHYKSAQIDEAWSDVFKFRIVTPNPWISHPLGCCQLSGPQRTLKETETWWINAVHKKTLILNYFKFGF